MKHSEEHTMENREITVVKVGGGVVEDEASLSLLLDHIAQLSGRVVLVHGGGRSATRIAARMGVETTMIGGRRVTDSEMLRIVTMVYGGLVGRNIVAQMAARSRRAVSLTGADLSLIRAHRRAVLPDGTDYGWVGDVDSVDGLSLLRLLADGIMPVVAPLTHDGRGHLLNTNADTIAQATATALAAADTQASVTLTYCFELPGVLRDAADTASLIPHIDTDAYASLVAEGIVSGGMLPKLDNAFAALRKGVKRVRITSVTDLPGGTTITL